MKAVTVSELRGGKKKKKKKSRDGSSSPSALSTGQNRLSASPLSHFITTNLVFVWGWVISSHLRKKAPHKPSLTKEQACIFCHAHMIQHYQGSLNSAQYFFSSKSSLAFKSDVCSMGKYIYSSIVSVFDSVQQPQYPTSPAT